MLALAPSPQPWLSVLLPVYGVEPYLLACARALLSQDLDGVELVFLDDASPDGSAAVLARLEELHPGCVRVLRSRENRGVAAARNRMLEAARGEYVWYFDPDDVMEPGAVRRLRRVVAAHAPDLVMCDFRVFSDDGRPVDRGDEHVRSFRGQSWTLSRDRDALLRGLFGAGEMHTWSKIVRRRCWPERLRFPEGRWFEDLAVMPRVALAVGSHYHADDVWVGYRRRAGSCTAGVSRRKLDDWMRALAGYAGELRRLDRPLSAPTLAAIAHFCARTWMRVGSLAEELEGGGAEDRRRHAELWRSACPWPARRLEREYWLRGRFERALRWGRWWRAAGV